MRMVTVTINDKKVEVAEGTTVLRAAEQAGITIPTLCDHKSLAPYGGCRLCLVEVEGARTLQPSCTLPVTPNMVVHTDTAKVKEARKFVLTLLFSERNHFCMYCQVSNGDCELQNSAYAEGMTHWPLQPNWTPFTVDATHPFMVIDNNRCILCRRCVRGCAELVGNFTLGIEERGSNSYLIADLGTPFGESTCISCGTCVSLCPTGAIIDRQSAYLGRAKDSIHTKSICTQCSIGCGIEVVHRDNNISRIEANWDAEVNGGLLCKHGRFEPVADNRNRILTPMVKKGEALKAATYQEAVDAIGKVIKSDSLASYISPKLPAETLYEFKKLFVDGVKNSQVTTLSDGAVFNFAGDGKKTLEGSLADVKDADCVITLGADLVETHQVAGFFVKRALPLGTKLIVVEDQSSKLSEYADEKHKTKEIAAVKNSGLLSKAAKVSIVLGLVTPSADVLKGLNELVDSLTKAGKEVSVLSLKGDANSYAAYLYQMAGSVDIKKAKAAFILLGEEEPSQKLLKDLEGVAFVAVQAAYSSPLTARADVVLPATIWSETEGHFVNLEGRIQKTVQVITPPEGIKSYHEVMDACAKAAGVKLDGEWKKAVNKNLLVTDLIEA
jgi:formate dehydrogenase major subunit